MNSEQFDGHILTVDGEINATKVLSAILSEDGHKVLESHNAKEAIEILKGQDVDVVVTDMILPDGMDGMDLFQYIKMEKPDIPVIFLSSYGTVDSAVQAMSKGAFYYFMKPPEYPKLKRIVSQALKERRLKNEVEVLRRELSHSRQEKTIIGKSRKMLEVFSLLKHIGESESSVLITGETGTGKELVAKELHNRRYSRKKPFVAVNCAAIPRELLEAELFGHEKGAFTGASSRRIGKLEEACGGTLFLDEIGDLEPSLQPKLLRVLQEKEIQRVGGVEKKKVDFRLICATNGNLKRQIDHGSFREDLYYRINVFHIPLPALRDRRDDIPLLTNKFLKEFCRRENKLVCIQDEVMEILTSYKWPGNVRQLKNAIERAVVLATGDTIRVKDLPEEIRSIRNTNKMALDIVPLRTLEKSAVREALVHCRGNKSRTAKMLGISRKALYKKLAEAR